MPRISGIASSGPGNATETLAMLIHKTTIDYLDVGYGSTLAVFMFVLSLIVNLAMWLERFVIIVTSLHRDFTPSAWGYFRPTLFDIGTYLGTIGLFFTAFLLFLRFLPMIAISEIKGVSPYADPHAKHNHGSGHGDHDHDKESH